jgi:hypothetical protein
MLSPSTNNHVAGGADVPQVFARSTIVPEAELMLHDTGPSSVAAGPGKSSPKKSQYLPIEPAQSKFGLKVDEICDTSTSFVASLSGIVSAQILCRRTYCCIVYITLI